MGIYLVSIGDREFEVSISDNGDVSLSMTPDLIDVLPVSKCVNSVLVGNKSTQIVAGETEGEYEVLLQNNPVNVKVETHRDRLLKKYSASSAKIHNRYEIHAPMPALVVKVEVIVGDEVKEGQGLLVLEAMKMENEIRSPQSGRVREIFVTRGKAVEKGELLLLLE